MKKKSLSDVALHAASVPEKSLKQMLAEAEALASSEVLKLKEIEAPFVAQQSAVKKAQEEVRALKESLRYERTQNLVKLVQDYPLAIDILAPEHTLNSCRNSQEGVHPNPDRCPRCFLQAAANGDYVLDTKFSFRIEEN